MLQLSTVERIDCEVVNVKTLIASISILVLVPVASEAFQKGMSLTSYWHDQYSYPESEVALVDLSQTNTEWISILATWYQDSVQSTEIYRDVLRTPDDSSLTYMINRAHELGLKVMLKPHVDIQDDTWRALIEFKREEDWEDWFSGYNDFIVHYARLAEENGVEQFCVGCELTGTIHRKADWENVIENIRASYSGPLTYAANYWPAYESVPFWDALDYIGIDAYFGLTQVYDPTLDELLSAWNRWVEEMEDFSQRMSKSVVITEIGYRSIDGCNIEPWDWWSPGVIDMEEQELCYAAACSMLLYWDWLEGLYFWSWEVDRLGGPQDDSYTPRKKPAEQVLRDWYARAETRVAEIPVAREEELELATYPVPFCERSVIRCRPGTLRIYDSAGRFIRAIEASSTVCYWDGRDRDGRQVRSGVYLYEMGGRTVKTVHVSK